MLLALIIICIVVELIFITLNMLRPTIESIIETGYIKTSHVIKIIVVLAYVIFLCFLTVFIKTSKIETDEKYEVLDIRGENVICVVSDDETVIYPLYDICYDENAEKIYAVKMSMQRDVTLGILKKDVEKYWFRVYTNDKSMLKDREIRIRDSYPF